MDTNSWTRIATRTGRYEYQFQGAGPAVRNAQYEDAKDYSFLVLDEEGWLYRIPVRVPADVESELARTAEAASASGDAVLRIAEAALRAGLEEFRPRRDAPYPELDRYFALDAARARALHLKE